MQPSAFMAAPASGQVAPACQEPMAARLATTLQISQLQLLGRICRRATARTMTRKPIPCRNAAEIPHVTATGPSGRNIASTSLV